MPWAIPYVANALMWKWIYDSNYGALNGLLYQFDFINSYMVWLGDADKTLPLIANAFVWKEVPLAAILLLVGLKTIRRICMPRRRSTAPMLYGVSFTSRCRR